MVVVLHGERVVGRGRRVGREGRVGRVGRVGREGRGGCALPQQPHEVAQQLHGLRHRLRLLLGGERAPHGGLGQQLLGGEARSVRRPRPGAFRVHVFVQVWFALLVRVTPTSSAHPSCDRFYLSLRYFK